MSFISEIWYSFAPVLVIDSVELRRGKKLTKFMSMNPASTDALNLHKSSIDPSVLKVNTSVFLVLKGKAKRTLEKNLHFNKPENKI